MTYKIRLVVWKCSLYCQNSSDNFSGKLSVFWYKCRKNNTSKKSSLCGVLVLKLKIEKKYSRTAMMQQIAGREGCVSITCVNPAS